jgi:hypothetical protein
MRKCKCETAQDKERISQLHSISSNERSGKITRGVYVFEDIGSYINSGTTREEFGIRIAKLWSALLLVEVGGEPSVLKVVPLSLRQLLIVRLPIN